MKEGPTRRTRRRTRSNLKSESTGASNVIQMHSRTMAISETREFIVAVSFTSPRVLSNKSLLLNGLRTGPKKQNSQYSGQ